MLQSIYLYALSVFKIPRKFSLTIEKNQEQFLWTGMEKKKRMALFTWEKVSIPINKEGLGLRRVLTMNDSLLAKLIRRWHQEEGECRDIWNDKYNRENLGFNLFLSNEVSQGGNLEMC